VREREKRKMAVGYYRGVSPSGAAHVLLQKYISFGKKEEKKGRNNNK
jgi:hypothetical protein